MKLIKDLYYKEFREDREENNARWSVKRRECEIGCGICWLGRMEQGERRGLSMNACAR